MFDGGKKKNQFVAQSDQSTTVIGQGVFIEGRTFKGTGTVRIDGVYVGEMHVDGHIIIGKTGEIKGDVTANTMVVSGTISGNIVCKEEVHFTESALAEGDILTETVVVDHGAAINGILNTKKKTVVSPIKLDDAIKGNKGAAFSELRKNAENFDAKASSE